VSTTADELRRLLTELDPAVRRQAWATLDADARTLVLEEPALA
jgi:hypothetical protein